MDTLHKQLRHMKRLKTVLKQPLKRSKHASEQNSPAVSIKCVHCQVEKCDAETQTSDIFHQGTFSNHMVETSDNGTQVSEAHYQAISSSVDACVQVTPTRIPRFVRNSESSPRSPKVYHTASQTEDNSYSEEISVKGFPSSPSSLFESIGNDNVQEKVLTYKLEERDCDSPTNCGTNKTVYNGNCLRVDGLYGTKALKYFLNLDGEGTSNPGAGDHLYQKQNRDIYQSGNLNCRGDDLSPCARPSLGIRNKMKNSSSLSPSGIPVLNGRCRRMSACNLPEHHQRSSIQRKCYSAHSGLKATSGGDAGSLQQFDYAPNVQMSEDLRELTQRIKESVSCGVFETAGDSGAPKSSKLPRPVSRKCLRVPTCCSPGKSPRARSVLSLQ